MINGVPQGSVLGPALFLVFINDLPDDLSSKTRMFADDCIVYREITSMQNQTTLQDDLDKLAAWEGLPLLEIQCSPSIQSQDTYGLQLQSLRHNLDGRKDHKIHGSGPAG